MQSRTLKPLLWGILIILVISLACNSPFSPEETPEAPALKEPAKEPAKEPVEVPEEPSGPVPIDNLQDAQGAVIQIEAVGSFVDPEYGEYEGAGRGTGFIIDPSGIAVTNNHVVTGAAMLKVWIGGDTSQTYNAKILGVSECSDLAVIDIDGEGFPYLEWYSDSVNVGLEVYTAGFPLGESEYTLTKGIVSKASTSGETDWASVDSVLMHDATINPGNSGGPLITEDGKVVGVNYSFRAEADQYFAIKYDIAAPIINRLRNGNDVDSIGVNGVAVMSNDGTISGIWVSSVEAGSPADKAGILGGDIILSLEDLSLATDGTMADYCDIIRTHTPTDTLALEVLRYDTYTFMSGQLNGTPLTLDTQAPAPSDGTSGETTSAGSHCGQTDANAYYEGFQVGSVVILGRHQAVDGDPNWADDMDYYVGDVATITELAGVDDTGCPGVRVDIDGGEFFWRVRALQFSGASDVPTVSGDYMSITDDTGALYVEVPSHWTDITGQIWEADWGTLHFRAANVIASYDLDGFNSYYDVAGIDFAASEDWGNIGGYIQLLDDAKYTWYEDNCEWESRESYDDGYYEGAYDLYSCTANATTAVIGARPINDPLAYLILVQMQLVTDADVDAFGRVIDTFDVVGNLP